MEHLRAENGKLAKELECERTERQRIEEALIVERESLNSEISELKSQLQVITKQKDGVEKDYQELLSNGNVTELSDTLSETQKELDGVFSLHCNNKQVRRQVADLQGKNKELEEELKEYKEKEISFTSSKESFPLIPYRDIIAPERIGKV